MFEEQVVAPKCKCGEHVGNWFDWRWEREAGPGPCRALEGVINVQKLGWVLG